MWTDTGGGCPLTTAVCSVCRDVVHVYGGLAAVHGAWLHGVFKPCAGSHVAPYCSNFYSDCCG